MALYDDLIAALPELEGSKAFTNGQITLQDDSDGEGAYIAQWEYSKPIPEGMKLGK
jgi:hypothetical protein